MTTAILANPALTSEEKSMLKVACQYFEANYYPHEEATDEEMKEYEHDLDTLWSAFEKAKAL